MIKGRVWCFKNNIDTDQIIGTQYLILPIEEMKKYTFEVVDRNFANEVKAGDIIVAGKNFGCGSSREQAPQVLKELGIKCIIAESFARIFFRNCINIGIPVIQIENIRELIKDGQIVEVNLEDGEMTNTFDNTIYTFNKLPDFLMEIINAGGLIESINKVK